MSKLFSSISLFLNKFLLKKNIEKLSKMASSYPKTLTGFGYDFNKDGILKQIDSNTGKLTEKGFEFKDQDHYEALGETITDRVYELLEENGMYKVYVNDNLPKEESAFIFMNKKELNQSKKLIVLIHGSGVVRAGQWSRSLIINHSLNHGTQIPYIKQAIELGYDVLITNTNDTCRKMNGVIKSIPGNSSPEGHACTIWEKYVIGSNPKSVGIVAHSYGGVVTLALAKKYPQFFKDKVFAIGFTDSVHYMHEKLEIHSHLKKIGRNWVASSNSLNTLISESGKDIPRYSAGHVKHEWTSYSCMSALFDFFENKYEKFNKK